MNNSLRPLTLGAAGLRGEVGAGLTPEAASDFASAFGTFVKGGRVLVGIDSRRSSPMLAAAVTAALAGCGCEVISGGVLAAGMVHFLTGHLQCDGALMISGGHQAPGWNAVIPIGRDGGYFDEIQRRELFDLFHGRRFIEVAADRVKPLRPLDAGALESYWRFIVSAVDTGAIRASKLTVLGDFCNGAGAPYAARFAELFGLKLVSINDAADGVISRSPDVNGISEEPLAKLIVPLKAQLGMVFNSDMSRLGLLSDRGEPLTEELTYPLAADYWLEKNGAKYPIVCNCCSSRTLDDIVAARGGKLVKSRVGQAAVMTEMRRCDGTMCGEGSGSFTFGAMPGFDAFLMAALILESVARRGPISRQLAAFKRYSIYKMTIPSHTSHGYSLLRRVRGKMQGGRISEVDGLRFDWADGFLSLRLAGTEPMIRLISESAKPELARDRIWQARTMLENQAVN